MGFNRDSVFNKYNGLCAYSGTPLESDWQVDHVVPKRFYVNDDLENLLPCQKIINHYKRALDLDTFRNVWLGKLHLRLKKLPVNPKVQRSINRKEYLLKVAAYFDIKPDQPFSGKFYFETIAPTVLL